MKKMEMVARVEGKMDEVLNYIECFNNGKNIKGEVVSVNTARTQMQLKKTQFSNLVVIRDLLKFFEGGTKDDICGENNTGLSSDTLERLMSLTTLVSDRRVSIEVKEGDNVLELLDKYSNVKDAWCKIKDACEASGLQIVGSSIVKK